MRLCIPRQMLAVNHGITFPKSRRNQMKNERDNAKTTTRRKRHKRQANAVEYLRLVSIKHVKQPKSCQGQLELFPAEPVVGQKSHG